MVINGILNIRAAYFLGLIAVVVLLPWSYHWSANAIVVTLILGLLSTSFNGKIERLRKNRSVLTFLILYLIYVIGYFYSVDRNEGMLGLEQKSFLIGLPVIVASSSCLSSSEIRNIFLAFIISNLGLTLTDFGLAMVSFIRGDVVIPNFDFNNQTNFANAIGDGEWWGRFAYIALSNKVIDPTYFSIYLIFSISILIFSETKITKSLKWIVIFWFGLFVLLLASRIGILLLSVVLTAAIFLKMNAIMIKKVAAATLVIGVLGGLVYLLPVTRFRMINEPLSTSSQLPTSPAGWNSTNLRIMEWKSSLDGIKMSGPFGTGTGGTWPLLKQNSSQYNLGVFSGAFNSHNQYLETILEVGVVGLIGLLACYIFPLLQAIQTKEYVLLSFSMIICLSSLTESIMERAHGLIFFTTFASILMYNNDHAATA